MSDPCESHVYAYPYELFLALHSVFFGRATERFQFLLDLISPSITLSSLIISYVGGFLFMKYP